MSDSRQTVSGLQLYKRLLSYSGHYKLALFIVFIVSIVAAASDTSFAAVVKELVDDGFIARNPDGAILYTGLMLALVVVRGLATFIGAYIITWVGRRVIFDIRSALFSRVVNLPASYYDNNSSSAIISKLIYDIEQLANAATNAIFVVIRNGLTVIGVFSYMTYLSWKLTALFLILVPVLVYMVRIMSRKLRKASENIQQSIGDITKVTQEATDGQRVVKAFNAQEQEIKVFNQANNRNRQQALKQVVASAGGTFVLEVVAGIAIGAVIYLALLQSAAGEFTTGGFVAYLTALLVLMPAAKRLSGVNQMLQAGIAASNSAFMLLDQEPESDTGTLERDRVQGSIQYKGVVFGYEEADGTAVENISFDVDSGQVIALVGASGSGKTTIANLLARYYTVSNGEILIDGININDFKLQNLRHHLAIVSQETMLFDDTIRNNIAYGHETEIDLKRLAAAANAAHVTEFVDKLSQGMDTLVGEKGLRLSGGQRQRIAIARAIYKNAPILIMDEATSALDTASERHVQAAIEALTENRTTLVIAHRLSTVERADKIMVMDQGRIIEIGTHKDLLAKNGAYSNLYKMQFRNEH
ncbi:MAG: lipid A export permease/ATP-binding protein MsbA [Acidiferrobacterales bacterium]